MPDLLLQVANLFVLGVILEALVNILTGKRERLQLSDMLSSMSHGTIMRMCKTVISTYKVVMYQWVYSKVCFFASV